MTTCSCIQGDYGFNFKLRSATCKIAVYEDLSDWMITPTKHVPDTYTIHIVSPSGHSSDIIVKTNGINKLTSFELEGNKNLCLIDGIYCVSTTICGIKYTKYIAFTCNAECDLSHFLVNLNSPEDIELGIKIKTYIDAVHASANQGELNTARHTYKILKRLIDTLNCKY